MLSRTWEVEPPRCRLLDSYRAASLGSAMVVTGVKGLDIWEMVVDSVWSECHSDKSQAI